MKEDLKPSLATMTAKASARFSRTLPARNAKFSYDDRIGLSPCDRDPRSVSASSKSHLSASKLSGAAGLGTDAGLGQLGR